MARTDTTRAAERAYHHTNKARILARRRELYAANPGPKRARQRVYRAMERDVLREVKQRKEAQRA